MQIIRKVLITSLCVLLLFSFVACGSENDSNDNVIAKNDASIEVLDMKLTGDVSENYEFIYPRVYLKNNSEKNVDTVYVELQVIDKEGNILESINPFIENISSKQNGWTTENYTLESKLEDVYSFKIIGYQLAEYTTDSYTLNVYEMNKYEKPYIFVKDDLSTDIEVDEY